MRFSDRGWRSGGLNALLLLVMILAMLSGPLVALAVDNALEEYSGYATDPLGLEAIGTGTVDVGAGVKLNVTGLNPLPVGVDYVLLGATLSVTGRRTNSTDTSSNLTVLNPTTSTPLVGSSQRFGTTWTTRSWTTNYTTTNIALQNYLAGFAPGSPLPLTLQPTNAITLDAVKLTVQAEPITAGPVITGQCTAADIHLVVDNSGSIGSSMTTYERNIKAFMSQVEQGMPGTNWRVTWFRADSSSVAGGAIRTGTSDWKADPADLSAFVDAMTSNGLTPTGNGIRDAVAGGRVPPAPLVNNTADIMIVLTDGAPNLALDVWPTTNYMAGAAAAVEQAEAARAAGWATMVVQIGPGDAVSPDWTSRVNRGIAGVDVAGPSGDVLPVADFSNLATALINALAPGCTRNIVVGKVAHPDGGVADRSTFSGTIDAGTAAELAWTDVPFEGFSAPIPVNADVPHVVQETPPADRWTIFGYAMGTVDAYGQPVCPTSPVAYTGTSQTVESGAGQAVVCVMNYRAPGPGITLTKYVSVDNGATWDDANMAPGPDAPVGSPVYFRFVVTNVGNVPLTGVTLTDSVYPTTGCTIPATMAPDQVAECVIGPISAQAGEHYNRGEVYGMYQGAAYGAYDPAYYIGPAGQLTLVKRFDPRSSGVTDAFNIVLDCDSPGFNGTYPLEAQQRTTLTGIPAGTTCNISEPVLPTAPAGWTFAAPTFDPGQSVAVGRDENVIVRVDNAITLDRGDLTIVKQFDPSTSGFTGTFDIEYDCQGMIAGTVTLPAGGSATIPGILAGTVCTVTETTAPVAPAGWSWLGPQFSPAASVTIVKDTASTVTVINAIEQDLGSLRINKDFDPGASGFTGNFTINYDCDGTAYNGTVTLAAGTSMQVNGIPAGLTCTVSEPTLPTPPAGWAFVPLVVFPPAGVTILKNQVVEATVTNAITRTDGTVVVTKVVDWADAEVDPTTQFSVCIRGATGAQSYPTGDCKSIGSSGGFAIWEAVLPGEYSVYEATNPDGWTQLVTPNLINVPATGGPTISTITNSVKPAEVATQASASLALYRAYEWTIDKNVNHPEVRLTLPYGVTQAHFNIRYDVVATRSVGRDSVTIAGTVDLENTGTGIGQVSEVVDQLQVSLDGGASWRVVASQVLHAVSDPPLVLAPDEAESYPYSFTFTPVQGGIYRNVARSMAQTVLPLTSGAAPPPAFANDLITDPSWVEAVAIPTVPATTQYASADISDVESIISGGPGIATRVNGVAIDGTPQSNVTGPWHVTPGPAGTVTFIIDETITANVDGAWTLRNLATVLPFGPLDSAYVTVIVTTEAPSTAVQLASWRQEVMLGGVHLEWVTSSEDDETLGFVILRGMSADGGDAQQVYRTAARGSAGQLTTYQWTDPLTAPGTYYYWVVEETNSGAPGDHSPAGKVVIASGQVVDPGSGGVSYDHAIYLPQTLRTQ